MIEAEQVAERVIERYRDFDKERRYGRVVMGLTDAQQQPLVDQAIHESGNSKFNDIQWLETQRELAARGYNKDQVLGFTPTVAQIGQSFDVSMPEAVKALEGAMLSFKKDVSTTEKAQASAQRTADMQVKASKISGMTFEDIVQLYKYAAAPARMAGLSEESMLAFGAISKKSNIGGDESGVAFRALAKNLISPTAGAIVAMRAAGVDYSKFQSAPKSMDTVGFTSMVAQRYGVQLSHGVQAGLGRIFHDPKLLGDPSKFTPAVTQFLKASLGGNDAKSLKSIAGLARTYRDDSAGQVDANGLMAATITAMAKNPALANSIFGSKQGGRIFAALGEPEVLNHILDELKNQSQGFAQKVSEERMSGFDGAVSRLQNSLANVETALGRAWDGGGSGGLMTDVTRAAARLTQAFAETSPTIQRSATEVAALGAAAAAAKGFDLFKGGFGLGPAAAKLDGSAIQLEAAARALQAAAGEGDVAGAIPGGRFGRAAARGGESLGVEALEIAATGAVTMSATTLMLGGLSAALVIDALSHSGPKRGHASDDPNFGAHERDPSWSAHKWPAHPDSVMPRRSDTGRVEARPFLETDATSHVIIGRGGVHERVAGAAPSATGYLNDRYGGAIVPEAPHGFVAPARPYTRTPTFTPFNDIWTEGGRPEIEHKSALAADHFRRDPEAARGEAMVHLETGPLDTAVERAAAVKNALASIDAQTATINLNIAELDAALSKIMQVKGALASIGTTGSTGPSRVVADMGVGRSR